MCEDTYDHKHWMRSMLDDHKRWSFHDHSVYKKKHFEWDFLRLSFFELKNKLKHKELKKTTTLKILETLQKYLLDMC